MAPRFPAPGGWDQFSDDLSDGGLTENEDSYDSYAETANGSETLSGVTVSSSDCFSLSESGWDDSTDDDAVSGMTDDDVSTDCYSMSDQGQDSTLKENRDIQGCFYLPCCAAIGEITRRVSRQQGCPPGSKGPDHSSHRSHSSHDRGLPVDGEMNHVDWACQALLSSQTSYSSRRSHAPRFVSRGMVGEQ